MYSGYGGRGATGAGRIDLIAGLNSSGEIFSTVVEGAYHPFVVYGLNVVISFILISLYNVQEQIEDPFDNEGLDDVMLDMYKLDYWNS